VSGVPRPIIIIDTSVFVRDALSRTGAGASSHVLALAPAIAHIVTCDEIVDELVETIVEHARWTKAQVLETYGPVLSASIVVNPVTETETHRRFVKHDLDDTLFIRIAEAIFTEASHILEANQLRLIVSENTNHFRPGSSYASFLCGTARDALVRLEAP
jgi:predicted nucleic acid-binding protein